MVATTRETTRTTPSAVLFPDSLASKSNIAPRVNIPPATIAVKLTNCPTRDILKQILSHNFDWAGNLAITMLEKAKPMASPIQGIVAKEEAGKPMSIWDWGSYQVGGRWVGTSS